MKTLHTRLDQQKEMVLAVTRKFGRSKAMQKFKVRDYERFSNWLEEVTGDEEYGLRPEISLDSRQTLGDLLVAAFLRKVAQLEAEDGRLRERIEYLEWQLDGHKDKEELQALAVLAACED